MKCFPLHISEEHCVMLSDELFSFATDSVSCYAFECTARRVNVSSHASLEHLTGFINTCSCICTMEKIWREWSGVSRDQTSFEGDVEGKKGLEWRPVENHKNIFFCYRSYCLEDMYRRYAANKTTGGFDGSVVKNRPKKL